jgi:NAD(P)-dependent dehydrogenase (short-subunit alcohol dehydrogenase family)
MSERTIALVTGANKGIGYEIAAGLGALGWSVGVGARNATLPDNGPTGGFFEDAGVVPW